jgi:fructokinase
VTLDVNLRPGMFSSLSAMLSLARTATRRADVVKATREEAAQLLGFAAAPRAARARRAWDDALVEGLLALGPGLVLLTLGEEGAVVARDGARVRVEAPRVDVVDATGAGDGFMGAVLAELTLLARAARKTDVRAALGAVGEEPLARLGEVGCRAGAAVVTAMGATTAMVRGRPRGVLLPSPTT